VNSTEFIDRYLLTTNEKLVELTRTKGREYANDTDQLANFKRLGRMLGLDPAQVAFVYLMKHIDALSSHLRDQDKELSEPISGRIDDAILYLILIKAQLDE
jgi:hypothetical protein